MKKIKAFFKFKKSGKVVICRVSDLLQKGHDPKKLMCEFMRVNHEVWDDITHPEYVWTEEMLKSQFKTCPELLYCAFEAGTLVGTASGFFCDEEDLGKYKTWLEKTAYGFYTHHKPNGKIAFGADLSVVRAASPKISNRLMLSILYPILSNGIKSLYLGSRIPSYHKHQDMNVEEYVFGKRKNGKPLDPELYFYLKDGFETVEIIPEYMDDPESLNYGVLIRWDNPLYEITKALPFLKIVIRFVGKALFLNNSKIKSGAFKAGSHAK